MDNLFSQDYNPFTGDIGFNPASFGLSLRDIDEAASVKLRAAMTSGGIALTADQYREIQSIAKTKYQGLDASSGLFNGSVLPAVDMTGKNPGLYLTQEYMGFWTGTEWSSYLGNNGNFEFQGDLNNYIRWNGTSLDIRGVVQLTDGTSIEDYVAQNSTKPMVNSEYNETLGKYQQWLNTGDLLPYTIGSSATGVYMTSQGLFGVKNGVNQFSISSTTGDAMFRGIVYASGGEFNGNILSTATITGGMLRTGDSGRRVEISGNNFRSYDSSGVIRAQTADQGMRFTDYTGTYNTDLSVRDFSGPGGIPWPYLLVGDTDSPYNRIGLRTSFLAGHPTSTDKSLSIYLDGASGGFITFRSIGGGGTSGTGVRLTSPDDDTLSFDGKKISFNGTILEKIGSDLYWNGVKIN